MGFGYTGEAIFVTETLEHRPYGLPQNYIVVENVDEWLMCIDSETGRIVSWDMSGYVQEDYESFDAYLLDQLENAIDNL